MMMIWKDWWIPSPVKKTVLGKHFRRFFLTSRLSLLVLLLPAITQSQTLDSLKIDSVSAIRPKKLGVGKNTGTKSELALSDTSLVDSTSSSKKKRHSPTKAALFSAALPGLGQGYNKKYWKIPIVYAGFGGLSYAVYYTATEFKGYRNAYRLQVDDNPATTGSYRGYVNAAELKIQRDYYKRYMDISAICMAVWYTLNIIDAAVDAHLFEWNMKDDIKMTWQPGLISTQTFNEPRAALGIRLQMGF